MIKDVTKKAWKLTQKKIINFFFFFKSHYKFSVFPKCLIFHRRSTEKCVVPQYNIIFVFKMIFKINFIRSVVLLL